MLLPIPHHSQEHPTSCLPASVCMVLAHCGINLSELVISQILHTEEEGTGLLNIELLHNAGLGVTVWSGEMDREALKDFLDRGVPVIAAVWTGRLPYWTDNRPHVVVAVGYDEQTIALNDPRFTEAPRTALWEDFLAAWEEFGRFGAIVRKED